MTGSCGSRSTRAGKPDGPRPRTPIHQDLAAVDSRGRDGFAPAGTQLASLGVTWLAIRIMVAVTANDVIRQSRGSTTIRDDQTLQFNMNGVHFSLRVLF